jgi:hypothetical protein
MVMPAKKPPAVFVSRARRRTKLTSNPKPTGDVQVANRNGLPAPHAPRKLRPERGSRVEPDSGDKVDHQKQNVCAELPLEELVGQEWMPRALPLPKAVDDERENAGD